MPTVQLVGRHVKGFGVGGKYVSHPYYCDKLSKLLGCQPYPGTLNFDAGMDWRELAGLCEPEVIPEVVWEGRRLGAVYAWRARLTTVRGDVRVLVIRPLLSGHKPTVLEIVACEELKPLLYEDEVMVSVECKARGEGLKWRSMPPVGVSLRAD